MSKENTWDQASHTLKLIADQELTFEQIKMLHDGRLSDLLVAIKKGSLPNRSAVRKFYGLDPLFYEKVYHFAIDYSKTFAEMIEEGEFDWVDGNVTEETFPIVGIGIVEYEAKMLEPKRTIHSEEVMDFIQKVGADIWQAARLEHLLAFSATYPYKKDEHPIFGGHPILALGSLSDGLVAYLGDGFRKDLDARSWGHEWHSGCLFMMVKRINK
jgi:hypothetical protein